VRNIFALADDYILPVLDVMADQDFRIIDTRHEQAAVHMADAWSRITEQRRLHVHHAGFAGGSGAGVEARFSRWEPALLNVAVQRAISPRAEAAIGRRKAAASQ
jgi:Thiamine pyrophosphate enzyme, N-terminal TPP binding domain